MLEYIFGKNKEKVLENMKNAYTFYMKSANALEKAAYDLHEKAKKSRDYVKKTLEKMEEFGGMIDKTLLKSYLANAKRNDENAANLMKRSVAFRAAADYVQSVYTIVKYADLGKNAPNIKIPDWVKKIINGDIPQVDEIVVDPPVTMDVYSTEIDNELNSMIEEYHREKVKQKAEMNNIEKKLDELGA